MLWAFHTHRRTSTQHGAHRRGATTRSTRDGTLYNAVSRIHDNYIFSPPLTGHYHYLNIILVNESSTIHVPDHARNTVQVQPMKSSHSRILERVPISLDPIPYLCCVMIE